MPSRTGESSGRESSAPQASGGMSLSRMSKNTPWLGSPRDASHSPAHDVASTRTSRTALRSSGVHDQALCPRSNGRRAAGSTRAAGAVAERNISSTVPGRHTRLPPSKSIT